MTLHFDAKQKEFYLQELTKDPLHWANMSILRIDELVKKGSHEPSKEEEIDPDVLVKDNRDWLLKHIELFEYLGLTIPSSFTDAVDKADKFLKDAA